MTLSEETWSTWTLTLGWPVMGIWKGDMDGSDINAVDRSPTHKVIATADDFGKVCLYRYPCVNSKAQCETFTGHSSHVTCVRWAAASPRNKQTIRDSYLISTGGEDKCVFQWKFVDTGLDTKPSKHNINTDVDSPVDDALSGSGFDVLNQAPSGGDEFTAVKVSCVIFIAYEGNMRCCWDPGLVGRHFCTHRVGTEVSGSLQNSPF
jgi:WD40 repeat protein